MRADISFKNYTDSDYEALCDYLIALNENDDSHINWNWARLECKICICFYMKTVFRSVIST